MEGSMIWRRFLLILLAAVLLFPSGTALGEDGQAADDGAPEETEEDTGDKKGWTMFEQPFGGTIYQPRMQYWVYTPEEMEADLPLVIYLHSSFGLCGKAIRDALPMMIRDGRVPEPDAVILVPQLTGGYSEPKQWEEVFGSLIPIIEKVIAEYEVDETRISLTGYSLGGIGVFDLASADPGRYARILSVCGKCHNPVLESLDAFDGTEVLVLTAQNDQTVNPASAIAFTDMLQEAGETAYHEEFNSTHGELPFMVYAQREVQEWLWLIPSISDNQPE